MWFSKKYAHICSNKNKYMTYPHEETKKKSFILYADLINIVEKLPKEKAGELFLIILNYANEKYVEIDDLLLEIAFEPIKQQMKRNLKSYNKSKEEKIISGRISALKRYHPEIYQRFLKKEITIEEALILRYKKPIQKEAGKEDKKKDKEDKIKFDFKKELKELGADENYTNEWLQVRKERKGVNTETALKSFVKELEISGKNINEVLKICIEKSWSGFKNEWLINLENNNKKTINGNNDTIKIGRQSVDTAINSVANWTQ